MPSVTSLLLNLSKIDAVTFFVLPGAKFLCRDEIKCEWFNKELLKR